MNCDFCKEHILATTQIAWNRGNYHDFCIGEAIAQQRAKDNQEDAENTPWQTEQILSCYGFGRDRCADCEQRQVFST